MEKCRRKVHATMCVPIVMCLCRKVVKCKKVTVSTNICDVSATSVQIKEWELNKGMGIIFDCIDFILAGKYAEYII